ncbi:MCE family protein [bacterium]|nr:MCE family protein [bacterium]
MKFSSSFKVGLLALFAIIILIFTVMWVKGRTLSTSERLTVDFRDINGMRTGSGVQMMGVRIGQVEELIPIMDGVNSRVSVKFVITEPNITIPKASTISIQQSGIIGEQFLEITPPKEKVMYLPVQPNSLVLHANDKVQMLLDKQYFDVGNVKDVEIVEKASLPKLIKENINTKMAYKITYIIDLPGLIVPERIKGKIVKDDNNEKFRISPVEDIEIPYPITTSDFTVIEPLRIADFMEIQYKSASSLVETNERLSLLLSDDVIADLQQTAVNINELTERANVTISKAEELIDVSKEELISLSNDASVLADKLMTLTDNLNKITGDEDFIKSISKTANSVEKLATDVTDLIDSDETKATLKNINITAKNIAELSSYVNDMSKDVGLKTAIKQSVEKLNTALDKLAVTLDTVNYATSDEEQLKKTLEDVSVASENIKKFSQKLNKRFLLFRLMF